MEPTFTEEFMAGTVGGVVGSMIVHPIDTLKTRRQTIPAHISTPDIIRTAMRKEGAFSLYRGLLAPVSGQGFLYALVFASNSFAKKCLRGNSDRELSLAEMTAAGGFAGAVNAGPRSVFERVKCVMQMAKGVDGPRYAWSGAAAAGIVRTQGIRGLFQGASSTFAREIPQFAIYYPAYEISKTWLEENTNFSQVSTRLVAGGFAGLTNWVPPIYCMDVVKSRMQTAPAGTYKSLMDCAVMTYRTGGVGVFFRGLELALARAFLLHGSVFCCYEAAMDQMLGRREDQLKPAKSLTGTKHRAQLIRRETSPAN
mmetsp:Transcript_31196/g.49103  ORF Transcript_31196/g.49103 Transcript_31196/m.49103 type:complete len:311 (-) Transcript_31196:879-1811(-)